MRFTGLSSGSGGNAWLFESGGKAILVDCGLSYKKLRERFDAVGFRPWDVEAVLVTHSHKDHWAALPKFLKLHGCPVYCTAGTVEGADMGDEKKGGIPFLMCYPVDLIGPRESVAIGGFTIQAHPVYHDVEAVTYTIVADGQKACCIFETGRISAEIRRDAADADAIVIEANYHDAQAVADSIDRGEIPESVGVSILTRHTSNLMVAEFLATAPLKAKLAVLAHISSQRNSPELALSTVQAALLKAKRDMWVAVAGQNEPTLWYDLQSLHVAETPAQGEW